ncbi:MAG: uridine kinase [Bdellovibrionia bacterium]
MFLVGIAGGSGSGKTTFANKIIQRVNDSSVALLHQDSYYLPSPPPHIRIHGEPNFDHPEAFDWHLLRDHLQRLKAGEQVASPVYDYRSSRRTAETEPVGPCKTVILEGIFTLWDQSIRDLFDLKIYLNVEADIRFIRRLHRDVRERGRTLDSIIRQYYDTVRPMHHEFLEPTRQYADIVVGEETDIAADVLAARIKELVYGGAQQDATKISGKVPQEEPLF